MVAEVVVVISASCSLAIFSKLGREVAYREECRNLGSSPTVNGLNSSGTAALPPVATITCRETAESLEPVARSVQ